MAIGTAVTYPDGLAKGLKVCLRRSLSFKQSAEELYFSLAELPCGSACAWRCGGTRSTRKNEVVRCCSDGGVEPVEAVT
jgi:hypothetical protein